MELDLEKVAANAPRRSPSPERREVRKEFSYPGSSIMSPVAGASRDSVPPMSSLHDDMPSSRMPTPPHERQYGSSEPKHPTWATPGTPLSDVPGEKQHDTTARPLSPSQVRGYALPVGYPGIDLNGRISSGGYPPAPSYPAVPYVYPPYADPHYNPYSMGRPMQHHPSEQQMFTDRRIPSMPRPENPYPVITAPGGPAYHYSPKGASPVSYHYSLESSS